MDKLQIENLVKEIISDCESNLPWDTTVIRIHSKALRILKNMDALDAGFPESVNVRNKTLSEAPRT